MFTAPKLEKFSTPVIVRNKLWYVEFYFLNPFDGKTYDRFRFTGQLNYASKLHEREKNAQALLQDITQALKDGFKPAKYDRLTLGKIPVAPAVAPVAPVVNMPAKVPTVAPWQQQQLPTPLPTTAPAQVPGTSTSTLLAALQEMADIMARGNGIATKRGYKTQINRMTEFLQQSGTDGTAQVDMPLHCFNYLHADQFQAWLLEEKNLGHTTINTCIGIIKAFLEKLFRRQQISFNPFYDVPWLKEGKGTNFIAFDQDEKNRIHQALKTDHPELYLFCNLIYTCYVRPKEICALTPADIDMQGGWIHIRKKTSKTDNDSQRQMMGGLKKLLLEYNVMALPKYQPIFAKICGTDKDLTARRRRVTDLWKKVVQDDVSKGGLGIKKEMYGFKHTGNVDYLKSLDSTSQADMLFLKQQNNHTTLETTQKYLKDLGMHKIKKEHITFGVF